MATKSAPESFDAALAAARAEADAANRRLEALDEAVRGIAGVLSTDHVLQLIVDRVRELLDAQYAALGIVGPHGLIELFITSGISQEQRAAIGPIPRGHGLLGLIIREGRSLRIPDIAHHPDSYGFPPHHPEMHSLLGVPVRAKGRIVGDLYMTNKQSAPAFSDEDERLADMFALHAGIAIENARMHEELQRLAVVDERDRISQDLHDSIIQSLYALSLSLEDLPEMFAEDRADATVRVERAIDTIHATIRDIRNLILGLRPALLQDLDLDEGMFALANEFRLNTMIDLELLMPDQLPPTSAEEVDQLLHITREALSNVARHSGASRAVLSLTANDGTLDLLIGDNGKGFDQDEGRTEGHHGLVNLQSRAEALGGSLQVKSKPGAGTEVRAHVPLSKHAHAD
jgi:two-component system, NarL family, sensor histidine kinase DevS